MNKKGRHHWEQVLYGVIVQYDHDRSAVDKAASAIHEIMEFTKRQYFLFGLITGITASLIAYALATL